MEIQAQFPPPEKATKRKVKTTKRTKIIRSNSIYFFVKTNIRHAYYNTQNPCGFFGFGLSS